MTKLTLIVCPHDTAKKPERWFRFIQYINHHLAVGIHLQVSLDFEDFHKHLDTVDIVYANPADTIRLIEQQGFFPLVRPTNLYDEVVFVSHPDVPNPTVESLQGANIATVKTMLPAKVALNSLKQRGITPAAVLDKPSWLGAINSVSKNEASFAIVYKDTYDELSQKTKEMVNAFDSSDEKIIFHSLCISPKAIAHKNDLEYILLRMDTDEAGKDVLQELCIEKWCQITPDEIDKIKQILSA